MPVTDSEASRWSPSTAQRWALSIGRTSAVERHVARASHHRCQRVVAQANLDGQTKRARWRSPRALCTAQGRCPSSAHRPLLAVGSASRSLRGLAPRPCSAPQLREMGPRSGTVARRVEHAGARATVGIASALSQALHRESGRSAAARPPLGSGGGPASSLDARIAAGAVIAAERSQRRRAPEQARAQPRAQAQHQAPARERNTRPWTP